MRTRNVVILAVALIIAGITATVAATPSLRDPIVAFTITEIKSSLEGGTTGQELYRTSTGLGWRTDPGSVTISDTAICIATAANTLGGNATNFGFDDTANSMFGFIGSGTSPGQWRFLEGSAGGTNYAAVKGATTYAADRVFTLPDTASDTFAFLAATQTFTNKTLTTPTLTTPVVASGLTASGSTSNDFSGSTGTFKTSTGVNTMGGEVDLAAGTTAIAPMKFASGTNLTTPTAGAAEYDGKVFYKTAVASSRQVEQTFQIIRLTSPYTLTSTTNEQKLFNAPTGGALTVASATCYNFDCYLSLTTMSATSGNMKFSPCGTGTAGSTATITNCTWHCSGLDATTPGTAAALSGCNLATTTADPISTGDIVVAGTGTGLFVHIWGTIAINAGGTLIPSCSLTTAATPTVDLNSYFAIWPLGAGTVQSVGNWN